MRGASFDENCVAEVGADRSAAQRSRVCEGLGACSASEHDSFVTVYSQLLMAWSSLSDFLCDVEPRHRRASSLGRGKFATGQLQCCKEIID